MTARFEAQRTALADVVAIPVTPFGEDGGVDQDTHRALLHAAARRRGQDRHAEWEHR